jgi:hypothetical protein
MRASTIRSAYPYADYRIAQQRGPRAMSSKVSCRTRSGNPAQRSGDYRFRREQKTWPNRSGPARLVHWNARNEDVLWDARARPSLRDKGAARSSSRETAPGCSEAARHWAAAATSPAALSLMAGESCDHPGAFRAPPTLQIPRPACAIASAISDHTTSIPPSTRESHPPNASSASSSPEDRFTRAQRAAGPRRSVRSALQHQRP